VDLLRTQTSLLAAVLSLAIAASVLIRGRRRRVHWLFGLFTLSIASWYATTFLGGLVKGELFQRLNLVCAIALPLAGVQFFRAFIAEETKRMQVLNRGALVVAGVLLVVSVSPWHDHVLLRSAIFLYVLVMLVAVLALVYMRGRRIPSRIEGARLRYLALVGALAALFTLADYLPLVGLDIPPVGTVLILVFLYVLSQSILRFRLLDLYELAGRLTVLTALAFTLAVIYWMLVELAGGRFFLHSVVAGLVVLLVFDPIRQKVEDQISQFFFRERYDLERTILELRGRLAHVLEIEDLTRILLAGFEQSRRVTHASVYLVDDDMRGYRLAGHVGPAPVARIDIAPARPLLDRLKKGEALVYETLERELEERRDLGEDRDAETVYEVLEALQAMHASVCVAIRSDQGDVYGLLTVKDDRLRDAFSPEETQLIRNAAAQAAIAVENSRLYSQLKERDRLAALGEMAAGLAHEIRNPLGAIKASAQFLEEPEGGASDGQREFLGIIVDEVDRLNRVVSSFLDFARPSRGHPSPTDLNGAVQKTMQLLGPECVAANVRFTIDLAESPPAVRIDVEQLRQVLINLVRNAIQAMEATRGGDLAITTRVREERRVDGSNQTFGEIRVSDTGQGISPKVRSTLFLPFVTTKDQGTGLGLAISQRLVTAVGGRIDVGDHTGSGTTFIVRLPAAEQPSFVEEPRPVEPAAPALRQSSPPEPSEEGEPATAAGERATRVATSR
jgi:two-component system, NtrC family, sensor histidine kinase HydH